MDVAMPAWMMRLWTAGTRIACFLAVTMPFAASARTILVPAQPVSPFADTEVSTNIVLHASRTDTREFGIHIQLRNDAQAVPRRFTATCGISPERSEPPQRSLEGCVAAFPELATTPPPAWLFREEWDMVRVTRRGVGVPSEWVRCDVKYASFAIKLR